MQSALQIWDWESRPGAEIRDGFCFIQSVLGSLQLLSPDHHGMSPWGNTGFALEINRELSQKWDLEAVFSPFFSLAWTPGMSLKFPVLLQAQLFPRPLCTRKYLPCICWAVAPLSFPEEFLYQAMSNHGIKDGFGRKLQRGLSRSTKTALHPFIH